MRRGRTFAAIAGLVLVMGGLALALSFARGSTAPVAADTQGIPHLELDMDPTNGTRPCSPIDASRAGAPTSGTYTVAICLDENGGAPDAFEATVQYTGNPGGIVSATNGVTSGDALDANPDFNQASGPNGSGTNWSCTGAGFALPSASPSPAHIVCNNKSFVAGELTADPGLLATLTLNATGQGTVTFSIIDVSNVNSPAGTSLNCGIDMTCPGGTVTQGSAVVGTATNTATPTSTPTVAATATPCNGTCPTATPTQTTVIGFKTFTPTPSSATPTPAPGSSETAAAADTATTAAGGSTGGEGSNGGGNQGSITPPNTGTGGSGAAGTPWLWVALVASTGAGVLIAGAMLRQHRAN